METTSTLTPTPTPPQAHNKNQAAFPLATQAPTSVDKTRQLLQVPLNHRQHRQHRFPPTAAQNLCISASASSPSSQPSPPSHHLSSSTQKTSSTFTPNFSDPSPSQSSPSSSSQIPPAAEPEQEQSTPTPSPPSSRCYSALSYPLPPQSPTPTRSQPRVSRRTLRLLPRTSVAWARMRKWGSVWKGC